MSFLSREFLDVIKSGDLNWHCTDVTITQKSLKDGYEFEGYGVIKNNEVGTIYLEFICTKANKIGKWVSQVPSDLRDENQTLFLEAKTINNYLVKSSQFVIVNKLLPVLPDVYHIPLSEIELSRIGDITKADNDYFYFETLGKFSIPKNKVNKETSTLGGWSASSNQTILNYNNYKIDIIEHKTYSSVFVSGSDISIDSVKERLQFYLDFSTGLKSQCYYSATQKGEVVSYKIHSINKARKNDRIPRPISDNAIDENKKLLKENHFDLLKNILRSPDEVFESSYVQWKQVWKSFVSKELSVIKLTVSVAIEGILNDIFIPKISNIVEDPEFEKSKANLISKLEESDSLESTEKEPLIAYVERWGKLNPKKALKWLAEKKIVTKQQVKEWENLRNSAAHPKLKDNNLAKNRRDENRTYICLGLFYRLILNAFSYEGPVYAFKSSLDNELILINYIAISEG